MPPNPDQKAKKSANIEMYEKKSVANSTNTMFMESQVRSEIKNKVITATAQRFYLFGESISLA